MPAALEVDREQVRIVAVAVGVREAARQYELPEATVQAWSARYGWFKREDEVEQVQERALAIKRENQGLQPSATKPAVQVLREYDGETRLDLAKGLRAGARTVAEMDGQEVLMASQQVSHLVKSAAIVHDWTRSVTVSVLGEVVSGSVPELPRDIIDV